MYTPSSGGTVYSQVTTSFTITAAAAHLRAFQPGLGQLHRRADGLGPMDRGQRPQRQHDQPGLRHDQHLGQPEMDRDRAVTAASGSGSYSWNTTGMAAGTYYIDGLHVHAVVRQHGLLAPHDLVHDHRRRAQLHAYQPGFGNLQRRADGFGPVDRCQRSQRQQDQPGLRHDQQLGQPEVDRDRRRQRPSTAATLQLEHDGRRGGDLLHRGLHVHAVVRQRGLSQLTTSFTVAAAAPSFALSSPASGSYNAGRPFRSNGPRPTSPAAARSAWPTTRPATGATRSGSRSTRVTAANGSGSYSWNTTGMAAGTYYIDGYMYTPSSGNAIYSHLTTSFTVTAPSQLRAFQPGLRQRTSRADDSGPMDRGQRPQREHDQPGLRHDQHLGQPDVDRGRRR